MARSKPRQQLTRFWQDDIGLGILLAFIATNIFVLGPLRDIGFLGHFSLGIAFSLILLSGIAATAQSRGVAIFFGIVALLTQIVHWVSWADPTHWLEFPDAVASLVATALLTGIIITQVFREGPVTIGRINGAITVYLLVGLIFDFAYTAVRLQIPNAFAMTTPLPDDAAATSSFLYFSLSTLTTVGYGDIVAVNPLARSLANLEALIGQMFPAVLLARLVSMELYYRQRSFEREQAELDRRAIAREIAKMLKDDPGPDDSAPRGRG
ncbi:MAG: ion channel [bacterium]